VPSISRDAGPDTMRAAARWLADQLGFAGGRVVETSGHPVVRGEWLGADGAPTILVYGHYDVQPTGSAAEWDAQRAAAVRLDHQPLNYGVAAGAGLVGWRGCPPVQVAGDAGPAPR
jgi:acetylornithine deacetylase/succinyl-diaminopimelate desuccinylase-like protein